MKLRKVEAKKNVQYPTYQSFLDRHRLEISAVATGLGLMFVAGCDPSVNTGGKPLPPKTAINSGNTPGTSGTPSRLSGEIAPAKPVVPDSKQETPAVLGKMAAPKTVKPKGKMKAPIPVQVKGEMIAPQPVKKDTKLNPKQVFVDGDMAEPAMPQKKE